jgi:hypothetical protein
VSKTLARAVALLWVAAAPAQAACYEVQGCTNTDVFSKRFLLREATCDILWQIRNQIYKENGYCFRTPRAIAEFGNAGCRHDDINAVGLNRYERANVAAAARVERMKGCAR